MGQLSRLSVLAVTIVAASIPVSGAAVASPAAGAITGSAWFDQNEDGVRQADEPAQANVPLLLVNTGRVVQTDEEGRYRFEDVPDGTYQLATYVTPSGLTETKGGGDSDFDPNTGLSGYVTVSGGEAGPVDVGYTKVRPDSAVSDVDVPELVAGSEVEIDVTFGNEGNRGETLWGNVVLPDGLTPLSANSPVTWIDGQRVHLSSQYQAATPIGGSVTYTIVARVDEEIHCAELVAEVVNQGDVDTGDNVVTVKISTE